jgi:lysophospholipase L1-like esterase
MRDRHFRSATQFFKFSPALLRLKLLPSWVLISLATNAVLLITLLFSLLRQSAPTASASNVATSEASTGSTSPGQLMTASRSTSQPAKLGERHQLTYEEWLDQLKREAESIAAQQPDRLTILAGDSISLWFPSNLLPTGRTWLNQAISGDTSSGLLKRLSFFDQTRPETIFVMIGINDLLREETSDQTIVENQRQIIQDLDKNHPDAQIVLQSILPHAKESNWEGRERLLNVSNQRIKELNRQLEQIAREEGVYFLDLYPLFANPDGDLRPELSTDGLHLSSLGYQTWGVALQVYSREVLDLDSEE